MEQEELRRLYKVCCVDCKWEKLCYIITRDDGIGEAICKKCYKSK